MSDTTHVTWRDGMAFDVELGGHTFAVDADEKVGGQNHGPKPKPLLLVALAGCTGMDVVSMLRKMRMQWSSFNLRVDGDLTDEHPKTYPRIHVTYTFTGDALDEAKINKAITLSLERYCGVASMLGKASTITHTLVTGP